MARWIPLLASIGLVSLMVLPAPGPWGLLIGVVCSLAILVAALVWLLDRLATRIATVWERRSGRRRRVMHPGSGMTHKAATHPAPVEPARPSLVQERARMAALRRAAGQQEPFRLR